MQKRADGHDTDVGSWPRLWARCVAAPHPGAALDCEVAAWPAAGESALGSGGAEDDPVHPVAAPISRMDAQASASHSRPVMWGALVADVPVNAARHASVILSIRLVSTARLSPLRYQAG